MMDDMNMGAAPVSGAEGSSAPASSTCTNCGMIMNNPEDHAGGDLNSTLCVNCASHEAEPASPQATAPAA